jgi:hypothetical protein
MNSPALKIASDSETESVDISVSLNARDELRLRLKISNGEIVESHLSGIGCTELLEQIDAWRPCLKGPLSQLPLPQGPGHAQVMLRELILKAQGRWNFPYEEEELCHCRAVPTKKSRRRHHWRLSHGRRREACHIREHILWNLPSRHRKYFELSTRSKNLINAGQIGKVLLGMLREKA